MTLSFTIAAMPLTDSAPRVGDAIAATPRQEKTSKAAIG
jgi:hypothetical protein